MHRYAIFNSPSHSLLRASRAPGLCHNVGRMKPKARNRRILVSPEHFAELLRGDLLVCSKCGRELSDRGARCHWASPLLKPATKANSKLARVLENFGYKRVLHEEVSGVASDVYVLIHEGVHRAQVSHSGKQVSVLLPGHYELYRDPKALEQALVAMFGPKSVSTV